MKREKVCQSCGFPLKRDTLGKGTEADGSISSHPFVRIFFIAA
jgi:hypothetical protein